MQGQKYNAFISYRRTARDTAVAKEIQQSLEHFHVPRGISDLSEQSGIERVFRDQEELEITSNLSRRIEDALEASEYLIVICSPGYNESRWCLHELETFIRMRGKDHVLCVLSEGEPPSVFPKLLLHDSEEVMTEDGTKVTVEKEIEPLACDYRGDFKTARRTELPRLAAVLLGCKYDELVMRRERYRRRRLAAVFSVTTVLAAAAIFWLIWSNALISRNYRQALINESKLLAMKSLDAFDTHDRLQALNDALEALTGETEDRPVTDEAQYAIAQASYAYSTPYQWLETWRIDEAADIDEFFVSRDGKTLVCMDHTGRFRSYEIDTRKELADFLVTENNMPMSPLEGTDGELLSFMNEGYLISTDYRTGVENWRTPIITSVPSFCPSNSGALIATGDVHGVVLLDTEGVPVRSLPLQEEIDAYVEDLCWSPDDSWIAVKLKYFGESKYQMGIFRTGTADFILLNPAFGRIEQFCFDGEGNFYLLGSDGKTEMKQTGKVTNLTTAGHTLIAFREGEEQWRQVVHADGSVDTGSILFGGEENDLYLALGNSISRFDRNGILRGSRNVEHEILKLSSVDSGEVNFVTRDGMIGTVFTDSGSGTLVRMFPEKTDDIAMNRTGAFQELQYVVRADGNISFYESVSDDSFVFFEGEGIPYRPDNFLRSGERLLVQAEKTLLFYNLETRRMERRMALEDQDAWHLLTENAGIAYLLRISGKDGGLSVAAMHMETGDMIYETALPTHDFFAAEGWFDPASRTEAIYMDRYYTAPSPVAVQGDLLAAHELDTYNTIVLFRLSNGNIRKLDVDDAMGDYVLVCEEDYVLLPSPLSITPDGKRIFTACTDPRDASRHAVLINIEDGTVTFLPGAPDDLSLTAFTEDGVIFSGTKEIYVCGYDGGLRMTIPYTGEKARSLAWYGNCLFCVFPDGSLVIYENGEEIRRVPLSFELSLNVITGKDFRYEFTPSRMYLYWNGNMNAVSLDSDGNTAVYYASSVIDRLEDRQELIVYSLDPEKVFRSGEMNRFVGSFREYTVEELIDRAKVQIASFSPLWQEVQTEQPKN